MSLCRIKQQFDFSIKKSFLGSIASLEGIKEEILTRTDITQKTLKP